LPMNEKVVSERTRIKRIFYALFALTIVIMCLGGWFGDFFLKKGLLFPMILVGLVMGTYLEVWMLSDCLKRQFKNKNTKKNWIGAILFFGPLGILVYFLKVYNKDLNLNY
jgi:hypothetical protein